MNIYSLSLPYSLSLVAPRRPLRCNPSFPSFFIPLQRCLQLCWRVEATVLSFRGSSLFSPYAAGRKERKSSLSSSGVHQPRTPPPPSGVPPYVLDHSRGPRRPSTPEQPSPRPRAFHLPDLPPTPHVHRIADDFRSIQAPPPLRSGETPPKYGTGEEFSPRRTWEPAGDALTPMLLPSPSLLLHRHGKALHGMTSPVQHTKFLNGDRLAGLQTPPPTGPRSPSVTAYGSFEEGDCISGSLPLAVNVSVC